MSQSPRLSRLRNQARKRHRRRPWRRGSQISISGSVIARNSFSWAGQIGGLPECAARYSVRIRVDRAGRPGFIYNDEFGAQLTRCARDGLLPRAVGADTAEVEQQRRSRFAMQRLMSQEIKKVGHDCLGRRPTAGAAPADDQYLTAHEGEH